MFRSVLSVFFLLDSYGTLGDIFKSLMAVYFSCLSRYHLVFTCLYSTPPYTAVSLCVLQVASRPSVRVVWSTAATGHHLSVVPTMPTWATSFRKFTQFHCSKYGFSF